MEVAYVWELCPHCENEVKLQALPIKQHCPVCNTLIKPCALCDMDEVLCSKCYLGED